MSAFFLPFPRSLSSSRYTAFVFQCEVSLAGSLFLPSTLCGLYHRALPALLAFSFVVALFLLILKGFMYVYDSVDYVFLFFLLKIGFEVIVFILFLGF